MGTQRPSDASGKPPAEAGRRIEDARNQHGVPLADTLHDGREDDAEADGARTRAHEDADGQQHGRHRMDERQQREANGIRHRAERQHETVRPPHREPAEEWLRCAKRELQQRNGDAHALIRLPAARRDGIQQQSDVPAHARADAIEQRTRDRCSKRSTMKSGSPPAGTGFGSRRYQHVCMP